MSRQHKQNAINHLTEKAYADIIIRDHSSSWEPNTSSIAAGSYGQRSVHPIYEYAFLQSAFEHFRRELFNGKLPACLITLQRHKGAYGYFSGDRFAKADDPTQITHEIALNPQHFDREPTEVLSVLVHEQAHMHQHVTGKPGRGGYHNREFASIMKAIGLMPSDTGRPGGAQVGDRMSHYIIEGGPFDGACRAFLAKNLPLLYRDRAAAASSPTDTERVRRSKKDASKTLYCCTNCPLKLWGKPGMWIICGRCQTEFEFQPPEDDPFQELKKGGAG